MGTPPDHRVVLFLLLVVMSAAFVAALALAFAWQSADRPRTVRPAATPRPRGRRFLGA